MRPAACNRLLVAARVGTALAAQPFLLQPIVEKCHMRWFFLAVGVAGWLLALGVVWIFAQSGGALTFIAAGVFATVAILALVGERIIKTLEEIRDGSVTRIRINTPADQVETERVVSEREAEQLATSR
jgi:hypothetical protein